MKWQCNWCAFDTEDIKLFKKHNSTYHKNRMKEYIQSEKNQKKRHKNE